MLCKKCNTHIYVFFTIFFSRHRGRALVGRFNQPPALGQVVRNTNTAYDGNLFPVANRGHFNAPASNSGREVSSVLTASQPRLHHFQPVNQQANNNNNNNLFNPKMPSNRVPPQSISWGNQGSRMTNQGIRLTNQAGPTPGKRGKLSNKKDHPPPPPPPPPPATTIPSTPTTASIVSAPIAAPQRFAGQQLAAVQQDTGINSNQGGAYQQRPAEGGGGGSLVRVQPLRLITSFPSSPPTPAGPAQAIPTFFPSSPAAVNEQVSNEQEEADRAPTVSLESDSHSSLNSSSVCSMYSPTSHPLPSSDSSDNSEEDSRRDILTRRRVEELEIAADKESFLQLP